MDKTKEVQIEDLNQLSFWYMRDNHTFKKLKGNSLNEILEEARLTALSNPHGMLCMPFLNGKKIGSNVHTDYRQNGIRFKESELQTWKQEILKALSSK